QRLSEHEAGWSEVCWGLVRDIKVLGMNIALRDEAAATLLCIDARKRRTMNFAPDMLVFDPTGKHLLMAKFIPNDPRNLERGGREEVRIWNSATDQINPLPQRTPDGYGPITFPADGAPRQLVWEKEGRGAILLWDLVGQKAIHRLEWPLGA